MESSLGRQTIIERPKERNPRFRQANLESGLIRSGIGGFTAEVKQDRRQMSTEVAKDRGEEPMPRGLKRGVAGNPVLAQDVGQASRGPDCLVDPAGKNQVQVPITVEISQSIDIE